MIQEFVKEISKVYGNKDAYKYIVDDKVISKTFKEKGHAISLPMKSQMESLNAGICASILMYELLGEKI